MRKKGGLFHWKIIAMLDFLLLFLAIAVQQIQASLIEPEDVRVFSGISSRR